MSMVPFEAHLPQFCVLRISWPNKARQRQRSHWLQHHPFDARNTSTVWRCLAILAVEEERKRRQTTHRRVCEIHGSDVLQYILDAADDDIYHLHIHGVASSLPAKWVGNIFAKGQSRLCKMLDGESEVKKDDGSSISGCFDWIFPKIVSKQLMEANRRWNDYYGGYVGMTVRQVSKANKQMNILNGTPVTKIFHLVVHAVRNHHTWMEAANERPRRMKRPCLEWKKTGTTAAKTITKVELVVTRFRGNSGLDFLSKCIHQTIFSIHFLKEPALMRIYKFINVLSTEVVSA